MKSIPFPLGDSIGVLLYMEYPTTIIYSSKDGDPIVEEWLDCNKSKALEWFYVYEIERKFLKSFIDKEISYFELMRNSKDNIGFLVKEEKYKIEKICVLSSEDIIKEYFSKDYFLTKKMELIQKKS